MPLGVEEGFSPLSGERPDGSMDYVVISGISCRLPESENMEEFKKHLMNGENMVTENRRWEPGSHGLPPEAGTLKDISKFDAAFFGVPPKLADNMDPQLRMMLELTYEALIDSGISPVTIRGSDTAVYVGCGLSETFEALSVGNVEFNGYNPLGCTASMFANRISFAFNLRGPSYGLRNGSASGLLALDRAVATIRNGDCDTAIVAGCNLCLKPATSVQLAEMNLLSSDGQCRCFDEGAAGYGRSEGVVVMCLQRKAKAKRVYCTVIHSKSSTFLTENNNINYPSFEEERKFLQDTYREARLDPSHVAYIEANSSCTKIADGIEMNAISDVICKNRSKPLLIGSVKSNIGHTENTSGLASVSKIVIAMEDGVIPPNLHYTNPYIQNGRLKIVNERTRLNGEYCSVNSFGLGGVNVHTIFKSFSDKSNKYHFANEKRRLCVYSARTSQGLESIFHLMKTHPRDSYLHYLLNETSGPWNKQLPYRGYLVLNSQNHVAEIQKIQIESQRPLWFVFSGMGTQWPKMGRQMMQIDTFRTSIMKCDRILRPHSISLYDMIMEGDVNTFDSVTNSFVAIAAIQVALVDLLFSMNIKPDGIVGHSVGELGCGYADGCQTAEETILAAYWRGHCIKEANLPPGGMAAIGMTWEEAKQKCPEGVVPACHNAKGTVTISGPVEKVSKFVQELKDKEIFAKEVNSAGVAFHSAFMQEVAPRLKEEIFKFLKPKPRTSKWISSSIPETEWHTDLAKMASSDYLVNNLVSPVLFQEALKHVPPNAVVIEIAPHGLLQAVLKRSLDPSCSMASLMKREHPCNLDFFFSNLGKCYIQGIDFNPLGMFPPIQHPVPRGTPMIAPAIKWDHSKSWYVPKLDQFLSGSSGRQAESRFEFDVKTVKDKFLLGHKIDGHVLFPATGYIVLAWNALAKFHGKLFDRMPVVIENFKIHRATMVPSKGSLNFEVSLIPVLREFEICEGDGLVASGNIYMPSEPIFGYNMDGVAPPSSPRKRKELNLDSSDVYKELRLRGYEYAREFRGIFKAVNRGDNGELLWNNNWITFLDTMMQMNLLTRPGSDLILPTGVKSLKIDPLSHKSNLRTADPSVVPVFIDCYSDTTSAGSVEMHGLQLTTASQKHNVKSAIVEKCQFIPNSELGGKELSPEELKEYCSICSSVASNGILRMMGMEGLDFPNFNVLRQVSKTLKPVRFVENVEKYLETSQNGLFVVLNKLFSMSTDNFVLNVRNFLDAYKDDLLKDKLLSNLLMSRSLKPCLDLVIENSAVSTIKVLELESPFLNMSDIVLQYCNSEPMVYIDYTKTLSDDSKKQTAVDDVKQVTWDLEQNPPENLNGIRLVIAHNILHRQSNISKSLRNISMVMDDEGFLLVHEITHNVHLHLAVTGLLTELPVVAETRSVACYCNEEKWIELFEKENFQIVSQRSDSLLNTLFLLRKKSSNDLPSQTVLNLKEDIAKSVDDLKLKMQEVIEKPKGHNLWLLADKSSSGILGMVKCLRKELGGDKIRCILGNSASDKKICLTEELVKRDIVMNVWKDRWGSYRHLPISPVLPMTEKLRGYMDIRRKGDLSSLYWTDIVDIHLKQTVSCKVHYASLGIKDLMYAMGRIPMKEKYRMGTEFSGVTDKGRKVMGVTCGQALATDVFVDQNFLLDVPEQWSLSEAATIPSAFGLAYCALNTKGKISKESSILITNASSSLGQAAVSIATAMGCQIFALVGTCECQQYLKFRYPSLQNIYVADKTEQFEGDIFRQTKGKGVDLILTSTAGNLHQMVVPVLKVGGKYLDLSSDYNSSFLDHDSLHDNISYEHVKTDNFVSEELTKIAALIKQGIKDKVVHPLDFTSYPHTKIQQAFQQLQDSSNLKTVLVQIRKDSDEVKVLTESKLCSPEKSYILVGGLGGFGLELAEFLVNEGATRLVLTSRSGITTGYQERKLRLLKERDIKVTVSARNVKTEDECAGLIEETQKIGPVGGIFNLAMVLKDGMFENQTAENFQKVCDPKVNGTINLDKITRKHCKASLDWFVVFSSVTSGRGNPGQTNYGYANSVMERLCEQRKADGLPGLAIQWGAIGDVGVVADKMGGNDIVVGGTLPQRMVSCLDTLKKLMTQPHAVASSFVPAEKVAESDDKEEDRKLTPLEAVMKVIGITDGSSVNPGTILIDLGLDSLMTTEIKQLMERQFSIVLTVAEIRKLTIKQLKEYSKGQDKVQIKGKQEDVTKESRVTMDTLMPSEEFVPIQIKENGSEPVFIVNVLPEMIKSFKPLAEDEDHSFYVVQCTDDSPLYSVQSLAGHYLQEIDLMYPEKPFHLIGYSIGGRICLEMALQKQRTTECKVKSLTLIEAPLPLIERSFKSREPGPDKEKEIYQCLLKVLYITKEPELNESESSEDLMTRVCDIIAQSSNGLLESKDIWRAVQSFLQKINIVLDYNPEGQYEGKTVIITPEDFTDTHAQQYFAKEIKHETLTIEDNVLTEQNIAKIKSLLHHNLTE